MSPKKETRSHAERRGKAETSSNGESRGKAETSSNGESRGKSDARGRTLTSRNTEARPSARRGGAASATRAVFTEEERLAMKERAQELKAAGQRGRGADKLDEESAVLAKLAGMSERDRAMGERIHAIIRAAAPALMPRLWYGMPAYARDGQVVCFFKDARKFKTRYATLGFSDKAHLDDGRMWPTEFALLELTAAEEERIAALVKQAVS